MRRAALALLLAAVVAAAVALVARPWGADAQAGEMKVTHASLHPGHIILVVANGSEEAARVAQVILNDAFVDFRASRRALAPGDAETITVVYPWIRGESYDIELMTSSGATVGYAIEEAAA